MRPPLPTSLGPPSTGSAVIIRARLPAGLERLRRRSIGDAADGVPAHLTLLYPFVAPERLDGSVRRTIVDVAATADPIDYELVGGARWPDTVYAAVDPVEPFVELQAALQAAFPAFPIYGEPPGFVFVPHVSIAEGAAAAGPTLADPGWRRLPSQSRAVALEVIARSDGGRWQTVWRIRLGRPGAETRG